jgi:hypothetical protein
LILANFSFHKHQQSDIERSRILTGFRVSQKSHPAFADFFFPALLTWDSFCSYIRKVVYYFNNSLILIL